MGTKMAPSPMRISSWIPWTHIFSRTRQLEAIHQQHLMHMNGFEKALEDFLRRLNSCHPTIRFTWTISSEGVDFLDTRIYKGSRFQQTGKTFYKSSNTSIFPPHTQREYSRAWSWARPSGSLGLTQARTITREPSLSSGTTCYAEGTRRSLLTRSSPQSHIPLGITT